MNIAYFSPLPPQKSGISDYSEALLSGLKNHGNVDLWIDGFKPSSCFKDNFKIFDYRANPFLLKHLFLYDTIVYNLGNNILYHKGIFETMSRFPGIVILHDYCLHHFFAGYWLDERKEFKGYEMELIYNYRTETAKNILKKNIIRPLWETDEVFKFPLNKRIIECAKGVIVHSKFVKDLLKTSSPLLKLNHPSFHLPQFKSLTKKEIGFPVDKCLLLSFGHVMPNKRLETVLKVIADTEDVKNSVQYLIIGEKSPYYNLESTIKKFGLQGVAKVLNYLPLEDVYTYLNIADIVVNLRYPTMGETSGSLIRVMQMGKPAIVTKAGWYDEMPDNCLIKINHEIEEEDLRYWLRRLIADENIRKQIGDNAKNYIKEEHSLEDFVNGFLDFAKNIKEKSLEDYLVNRISYEFISMGIDETNKVIQRVSSEVSKMYNFDKVLK